MKRTLLAIIAISIGMSCFSQTDTTDKEKADTIKIGGMIIIRKGDKSDTTKNRNIIISNRNKKKSSTVTTNWWIVDLGFSNFHDETNYASAEAQQMAPGINEEWFDLRTGKSVNVNLWLFMQRLKLVKNVVNLKYGLGVELNNYRFSDEHIIFQKNPTLISYETTGDYADIKKNKLAVDYVTVPLMLNFNLAPGKGRGKSFGFSAGVSGGYLYSARQKLKFTNDDKRKTHDDFDLRKWKLSYIGELGLGPVKLYGSYAPKSMWEKGFDHKPYNLGIRFGKL